VAMSYAAHPSPRAVISNDRSRAWWSKIWAVTISSLASGARHERIQPLAGPSPASPPRNTQVLSRSMACSIGIKTPSEILDRRRQPARPAPAQVEERLLERGEQPRGLGVAVGRDDVDAEHDVWAVELLGGLEAAPVEVYGLHHQRRREVGGECKGQSIAAASRAPKRLEPKDPDRHIETSAGTACTTWPGPAGRK